MLSRGRKVTVACYYLSVPMEFIKIADAPWQDSAQAGKSFSDSCPRGSKRLKRRVSFVSNRHRLQGLFDSRKLVHKETERCCFVL